MKDFVCCFVAVSIFATVALNGQTGKTVQLVPANPLAAAHSKFQGSPAFRIAPNTPAFEEYGLNFMLVQVNEFRSKWKLDISKALELRDVLFYVKPMALGVEGAIETRDGRFKWVFNRNAINYFVDLQYGPPSFRYKDEESAKLAKSTSQITGKEAEAIARDALHQLGMTERQLKLKTTPQVNQYKFEESDGTVYPLPVFNITWRYEGPTSYAAENLESAPLVMDISGIVTNVVEYFNVQIAAPNSAIPRPQLPTNYFKMLGLPDNYLETVPERKRALWGLPPLTNSAATAAEPSK